MRGQGRKLRAAAAALIVGAVVLAPSAAGDPSQALHNRDAALAAKSRAAVLSLYVIALALVNFTSVVVQCGLGECHTTGYALLK